MQIRLTVLAPRSGQTPARACDVLVTAPAGTALAAVASHLAASVSGPDGSLGSGAVVLFAGRERLDAQRCALGEPPLVDGAVLSLQVPGGDETPDDTVPAQLHVIAGPDAGGVHLLHGGQIRIGRSADADVPLDDPDVSRLHCAVTVSAEGRVSVADLGSTNGTSLDGTDVRDRPVRLTPGALLRLGESTLRLTSGARTPALGTAPDGEGHLRVARAPSAAPAPPDHSYGPAYGGPEEHDGADAAHDHERFPGADGPAPARPHSGPGRTGRTPDDGPPRRGIGAWARRLAGGKADPVHESVPDEAGAPAPAATFTALPTAPEGTWPDPASVLLTALGPGPRLWERDIAHPEALVVRLGTTDRADLPAVPVTVGLREAGSLGLAGPRERLAGLARSTMAQLAALHSPADLEIVLISTDRPAARTSGGASGRGSAGSRICARCTARTAGCCWRTTVSRRSPGRRNWCAAGRGPARPGLGEPRSRHGRRGRPSLRGSVHRGGRRRRPRFRGAAREHRPAGRGRCGGGHPSGLSGGDPGRHPHVTGRRDVRGGLPCLDRLPGVRGRGHAQR